MPICHVAWDHDGKPVVTPTMQWRDGNVIYWQGSSASRFIRAATDHDVCGNVMMTDGLVLARSAFNYTLNHVSMR